MTTDKRTDAWTSQIQNAFSR